MPGRRCQLPRPRAKGGVLLLSTTLSEIPTRLASAIIKTKATREIGLLRSTP